MPRMIHIEPDHYDNKYQFWHSHRQRRKDLVEQLKADQKVVRDYPSTEVPPAKVEKTTNPFWNPVRIYEAVNHFLPAFILKWVLKNKVKDSQFVGSVKFSLGMFVVPVFYLIQAGLCFIISQSWTITVVYFCSLPLSLLLRR